MDAQCQGWQLDPDVSMVATEYGAVLLHEVRGTYWQLNATGTQVMDAVLAGEGADEVADRLAAAHSVPPEQVRADVQDLVRGLLRARLLQPVGAR